MAAATMHDAAPRDTSTDHHNALDETKSNDTPDIIVTFHPRLEPKTAEEVLAALLSGKVRVVTNAPYEVLSYTSTAPATTEATPRSGLAAFEDSRRLHRQAEIAMALAVELFVEEGRSERAKDRDHRDHEMRVAALFAGEMASTGARMAHHNVFCDHDLFRRGS